MISAGLACYNYKSHVPSDIGQNSKFLTPENVQTNKHLSKISEWTNKQLMHINDQKTKYMIFNFCDSTEFQTRLYINDTLLEQVHETRLLGVIL